MIWGEYSLFLRICDSVHISLPLFWGSLNHKEETWQQKWKGAQWSMAGLTIAFCRLAKFNWQKLAQTLLSAPFAPQCRSLFAYFTDQVWPFIPEDGKKSFLVLSIKVTLYSIVQSYYKRYKRGKCTSHGHN